MTLDFANGLLCSHNRSETSETWDNGISLSYNALKSLNHFRAGHSR